MGFIEDERRRKAAELDAQRRRSSLMQQQERDRRQREASKEAAIKAQAAKSKQQFEQSGLREMIEELKNLGSHESIFEFNMGVNHSVDITVSQKGLVSNEVKIETTPDGTIKIQGGLLGSTTLSKDKWQGKNGKEALERALGKGYKHPLMEVYKARPGETGPTPPDDHGPCLPGNSRISTPNGSVLVKDLQVGDYVWTSDRFGGRVQTIIVKKTKRIASKNHKMAHVILADGRELVVSPGHPIIDYKQIGSLVKGGDLDMSYVASIKVIPYKGKYTYDILPYGDTGGYWANNIPIGSTLSDQFQRTVSYGLYKPLYLSL